MALTRPDGSTLTYTESVRLYDPDEVRGMMADAGFGEIAAIDSPSPRLLLTGRREC